MELHCILSILILSIVPGTMAMKASSRTGWSPSLKIPGRTKLDQADPVLSMFRSLSDPNNLAALDTNVRHQRQIIFKSSYQELPKSLENPLRGGDTTNKDEDLSYFVQVNVDDPPPSTALTTIPEGVKTYFPPQVSDLVASIIKAKESKVEEQQSNQNIIGTNGKQIQQGDIIQEEADSSTPQQKSSNSKTTSNITQKDNNIPTSKKFHHNTPKTSQFPAMAKKMPKPRSSISASPILIRKNPKNPTQQETEESSYLSYTPKSSIQSQNRITTSSRSPKLTSTKNPFTNLANNEKSNVESKHPSPSLSTKDITTFSPSQPIPGQLISKFSLPPSTKFPKKVFSSATSPLPSFVKVNASQMQPITNTRKSSFFPASFSSLRSPSQNQPDKEISQSPTISKLKPFVFSPILGGSKPSIKSSNINSFSNQQTTTTKSPNTQLFKTISKFNIQNQHLSPPTRNSSPSPRSKAKSVSSNPTHKELPIQSDNRLPLQTSIKDGKTRTLVSSDGISNPQGGLDSLSLQTIPETSFDCSSKSYGGYYADQEANCEVFHICWGRRSATFRCPEGTMFNQQQLVCDWWYNVDCSETDVFAVDNGRIFEFWDANQI